MVRGLWLSSLGLGRRVVGQQRRDFQNGACDASASTYRVACLADTTLVGFMPRGQPTILNAGDKFGRWVIVGPAPPAGRLRNRVRYYCMCECGAGPASVGGSELATGRSSSCGCLARERSGAARWKHGLSSHPTYAAIYKIWQGMMSRCENPRDIGYENYGGRGIRVCDRWRDPAIFCADLPPRPSEAHSLGRIDNDGHYEPSNVRWETQREQTNNTRANRRLTLNGKTQNAIQWARELGINPNALYERLRRGWPVERALTTPTMHTGGAARKKILNWEAEPKRKSRMNRVQLAHKLAASRELLGRRK